MKRAGTGRLLDGIDAIVIAYNERSTRSQRSEQLIHRLRETIPDTPVAVVHIGNDDTAGNRRKLLASLQSAPAGRSLLVVAGGDGTAHFVTSTLLHPETPPKYRTTPVTVWPLGNGNDFFYSVHSVAVAHDPLLALLSPELRSVKIYPLEWHIQNGGHELRKLSLCYGTIGATGAATVRINEPEHRERRKHTTGLNTLWLDIRQGSSSMWFPKRFTVHANDGTYRAIELQFNNGPLMTMRAHYPVLLSDHAMFFSKTCPNNPLAVGATVVRMGVGAPAGVRQTKPLHFRLESDGPIHAQTDGEAFELPPEVSFSIGPGKEPIVVWASKIA